MQLKVLRLSDNGDSTIGALYINDIFKCFTIEDEKREEKVMGETRVPEGKYDVSLRAEGGYHNRYSSRYSNIHKGMLCIHNAPDWKIVTPKMEFQYILIHTGNTDDHTNGCLLVNYGIDGKRFIGNTSRDAYVDIYPEIAKACETGKVTIEYIDINSI